MIKKLIFITLIINILFLVSGCDNDHRPTRAFYHYVELEHENDQKQDEENEYEKENMDENLEIEKSKILDGQNKKDLTRLENILGLETGE